MARRVNARAHRLGYGWTLLFLVFLQPAFAARFWGDEGLVIRDGTGENGFGTVQAIQLVESGETVWLVWLDNRNNSDQAGGEIYIQSVGPMGNQAFEPGGQRLPAQGWCPDASGFSAISDGDGGIIVCSTDQERQNSPKVVQRYSPDGLPYWIDPIVLEVPLLDQFLHTDDNNGALLLTGSLELELRLFHIFSDGSHSDYTVFSEGTARYCMPVGIARRGNGYLAVGRIIYSANSSELRRLNISREGEPDHPLSGTIFYYGRYQNGRMESLDNKSLFLMTGDYFVLYGELFSTSGFPNWGQFPQMHLLMSTPVAAMAIAPKEEGFWLQTISGDPGDEIMTFRSCNLDGEIDSDPVELTDSPAGLSLIPPLNDTADGIFALTHVSGDLQPQVCQYDNGGDPYSDYDTPIFLDTLSVAASALASCRLGNHFVIAYRQQRTGWIEPGLILQRFNNSLYPEAVDGEPAWTPATPNLITAWPNPSNGSFGLHYQSPAHGLLTLTIVDLLGRQVYRNLLPVEAGDVRVHLPSDDLPAGCYFLTGSQSGVERTIRLIKLP